MVLHTPWHDRRGLKNGGRDDENGSQSTASRGNMSGLPRHRREPFGRRDMSAM